MKSLGFVDCKVKEYGEEGVDFGRIADSSKALFLEKYPRNGPVKLPRNLFVVGYKCEEKIEIN